MLQRPKALTSILIQINRSGIVSHSGIKIIGQEHYTNWLCYDRGFPCSPVAGIPMIEHGDSLGDIILGAVAAAGQSFEDGDVVCLAQKIVSKAEGQISRFPA